MLYCLWVIHMLRINIDQIVEITASELRYINDRGAIDSIILADCARNFALNNGAESFCCVGERCFVPEKGVAFYEFYNGDHTQVYLRISYEKIKRLFLKLNLNMYQKDLSKFHGVQKELNHYGWTTMDIA